MKKLIISALLLCSGMIASAQLFNVSSIEKVTLPEGVASYVSIMSPEGSYVALTDNQANLAKIDLNTNQLVPLATNVSSYDIKILNDGSQVLYREVKIGGDRLRRVALKSVNVASASQTTVVDFTRNLQGFAIAEGNVFSVDNGKFASKVLKGAKVAAVPTASINKGQLCVTVNGKTTQISPNGTSGQSYLWPSISPDGTKVVYYLSTVGCYVCNLDGSNPVYLGIIRAPKWCGNNVVVGMRNFDDGHVVTKSAVVASTIDGKTQQTLTPDNMKAMYPSATLDGAKISFTTPEGELYIINTK